MPLQIFILAWQSEQLMASRSASNSQGPSPHIKKHQGLFTPHFLLFPVNP